MVRRPGDDKKFPGGRAAERLKLFELQRGLEEVPEPAGPDPDRPPHEGSGQDEK